METSPAMNKFTAECKIYKMATDLFVCETEGACPYSIHFADRKFCKNNAVIKQCLPQQMFHES